MPEVSSTKYIRDKLARASVLVRQWFARIAGLGILIAFFIPIVHRIFPDSFPYFLGWDFFHASVFAVVVVVAESFLKLCDRTERIEQALCLEPNRRRGFWVHAEKEEAFRVVCDLLRDRGKGSKKVDLIQFSGQTAIPVLDEIAKSCPHAEIRLLLIDHDYSQQFDDPNFHLHRIKTTEDHIDKLLKPKYPKLKVSKQKYKTEAGLSAIIVDNWLVSVGWYVVYPDKRVSTGLSIRGHNQAAITAVDAEAPALMAMARSQFDTLWHS